MRQLTFTGAGRLEWSEVPEPRLDSERAAVVRPIAAARCDLDAIWMRSPLGRALRVATAAHLVDRAASEAIAGAPPYAPPFAVGHECVAEVVALGAQVASVRPGPRVVVPFHARATERAVSGWHAPTHA